MSNIPVGKIPYCTYPVTKGDKVVQVPYLRYVNSNGREIDLTQPPFIGEASNGLLGFKWNPITQGQAVLKIVKFEKTMIEKKFKVVISGDDDADYYDNLEKFLQLTDVDINNLKMGRLYMGEYFLEGYIVASGKPRRYLATNKTVIECSFVCEKGNWQKEGKFYFHRDAIEQSAEGNDDYTANGIDYDYDYDYDYCAPFGKGTIINESYFDTDFEITFYGAMQNPKVIIGGNTYEFINTPISADEYIKINSKTKTAILYRKSGEQVNIFKFRNRDFGLYEKIKGGGNVVIIDDNHANIDITLFYERSEPKWGNNLWT